MHKRNNAGDVLHNPNIIVFPHHLRLSGSDANSTTSNDMYNIYQEFSQIYCDSNHQSVRNTPLDDDQYNHDQSINKETKRNL